MSDPLNRQNGFSLTEVLLAMMLMVMVVTALGGYYRALASGFSTFSQERQLWRYVWQQAQLEPTLLPPGWQLQRREVTAAGCTSITAIVRSPAGRQGELTRLFCPNRE